MPSCKPSAAAQQALSPRPRTLPQVALGASAGPSGIIMDAVRTGAVFSLLQGAFYQVGNWMSGKKTPQEDLAFAHTRHMLGLLGLQRYEKNFQKGQLDDLTLPLLTDRRALSCSSRKAARHADFHSRFLQRTERGEDPAGAAPAHPAARGLPACRGGVACIAVAIRATARAAEQRAWTAVAGAPGRRCVVTESLGLPRSRVNAALRASWTGA